MAASAPPAAPPGDARLQLPELGKRNRRARNLVALLLVLGTAIAGYMYLTRAKPPSEVFRTVEVERRTIVRVIEATGHLDARARVEVAAPVAGHLAEIKVQPGDSVEQGALLARLDDRATALGVRSAGTTLEASVWRVAEARSAADNAEQQREHVQRLVERGLASQQELEAAKAAATRARAVLKTANAEKKLAGDNVAVAKFGKSLGDIVSPISGIVLTGPQTVGVSVAPEQGALFVIASPLERMRIDAAVSEADIGDVRVGQLGRFEVQTFPGREFQARVERIGLDPTREGAVVTYPVLLSADNPERALLPGMTASVRIEVAQLDDALAVREAALRFVPEGAPEAPSRTRVWRSEGAAHLDAVQVNAGLSDGVYTAIELADGEQLAPGDFVAVGLLQLTGDGRAQPGVSLGSKK